jgi:hopanoid biosynthesis associated radical SAM protein HpnH
MAIPFFKEIKIGGYLMKQKLLGRKRYPLVLMLEPLFRCNLACAGCGKIDYPDEILNQRMSVQQCMDAIDECGAPAVSIAGGEPLLHRDMAKIVEGYIERDKFVILCTNALLLAKVEQAKAFNEGTVTLSGALGGLTTQVGAAARSAEYSLMAQQVITDQAQAARDSISGVNLDEEASDMLRLQQAYQAASQLISTADTMFQSILRATGR